MEQSYYIKAEDPSLDKEIILERKKLFNSAFYGEGKAKLKALRELQQQGFTSLFHEGTHIIVNEEVHRLQELYSEV